jgi:hypothetical protein
MDRLAHASASASADEAYVLVADTLNEVEDEFSGVEFNPSNWRTDGRLYPPLEDNKHLVLGYPLVSRYRSVAHNLFIGSNGSIEIQTIRGDVLLQKAGADGRRVWQI